MIATWASSNGLNAGLSFFLPLSDAGAGAVTTTPASAGGSPTPTFTRATAAWTKLSTGLWASVASGTARSCYLGADTAVGAYGGYFAEGAGTQLVTPSADIRDMTGAGWVALNVTVAKTATGIDGTANSASTLTCTSNGGTVLHLLVAAASDRTYSAWIRRVTGTGTVKLVQGATKSSDFAGSINSSTYTRVVLDATVDVTLLGYGIELGTSGDVIEVDFNQFEAGAFATSPMASAGAARNADSLTYVFAGNAVASVGSAYAELSSEWSGDPGVAACAITFDGSGGPLIVVAGGATTIVINDGSVNTRKSLLTSMNTAVRKRASSWGAAGLSVTGDGAAPATSAFDGAMANTSIGIGTSWMGTVQNVRIYSVQLLDAQLQAMTT